MSRQYGRDQRLGKKGAQFLRPQTGFGDSPDGKHETTFLRRRACQLMCPSPPIVVQVHGDIAEL